MKKLILITSAIALTILANPFWASPLVAQIQPSRAVSAKTLDISRNIPSLARQPNLPSSLFGAPSSAPKARFTVSPNLAAKLAEANPNLLAAAISSAIAPNVVSVAVSIRMPDGRVGSSADGMARRAPDPSPRELTADDRITVASVSKVLTAATTLKLLREKKIDPESPIGDWLPTGWSVDESVKAITFGQLMNHTSGIRNCLITHDELESCVATPVLPAQKVFEYVNANHALLRVLIARLAGVGLHTDASPETIAMTYIEQVNKLVLAPAGIPYTNCRRSGATPALSYKSASTDPAKFYDFTTVGPGEDWGNMSLYCGSQGWTLSANDLSMLMHKMFVTGSVLDVNDRVEMNQNSYGIFYENQNFGFPGYGHSGYHPASDNKGEINTYAFASNSGISVGLIINSPYKGDYKGVLSNILSKVD
jgi:CubicO group peptidase (beta-lactamase class C family)